jgi:predicted nucleotide-binding protein (sugar kinase/HSP70/actin superfamily)
MIITFPHLGDVHIAARLLFNEMGVETVVPDMNTSKALERGAAISPEEMCLPFKIMAGNLAYAFDRGANTAIMPATLGPCRLGKYAELLHSVLSKAGMRFNWIVIESPEQIGVKEFINRLGNIVSGKRVRTYKAIALLNDAVRLMRRLDGLRARAHELSGIALVPRECLRVLKKCTEELSRTESMRGAFKVVRKWERELEQIATDKNKNPIKILVTGEVYTMIEPFANKNLDLKLMEMGVSFSKRVNVSWWMRHTLKEGICRGPLKVFNRNHREINKYLKHDIGGYSKQTVSEGVICKKDGYDGIIQVLPTGCMPEIVAKSILTRISAQHNINMLNIIYDEMDGETGYITRLEAFVDMLERRRRCTI